MVAVHSSESPLDTAAETVNPEIVEAFKSLANSYRLGILLALWEVTDPGPPMSNFEEPSLTFTELRERVGLRDAGQFTYHLDMLVGSFVESTSDGYRLSPPGKQFLQAVFAGTLIDHPSVEGEPVDAECLNCGAQRIMDYSDGIMTERCPECEGLWEIPGEPPGVISKLYRPPVGLMNRTPQGFYQNGNTWDRHREHMLMEGCCPDCSGAVSTTLHICEDHEVTEGTVCDSCRTIFEILSFFICDVCKYTYLAPVYRMIFTEMAVKAFFYEHGLDVDSLVHTEWSTLHDAIAAVEIRAKDPLEIGVTVELDGDSLSVMLDDDARVVDVAKLDR